MLKLPMTPTCKDETNLEHASSPKEGPYGIVESKSKAGVFPAVNLAPSLF